MGRERREECGEQGAASRPYITPKNVVVMR